MKNISIQTIPLLNLGLAFIPVGFVILMLCRWAVNVRGTIYALGRMLIQLLLVGYVLAYLFNTKNALLVIITLSGMLVFASWISLRPLAKKRNKLYFKALIAITFGGVSTLLLITQAVLDLSPWYSPRHLIPLAGMIFANAMNTVSLAAERFSSETDAGRPYHEARKIALQAALIPLTNMLLAVGLVSIPGLMTGQILSHVSPLIAARYQIMVMCMVFGSAGISAVCFLLFVSSEKHLLQTIFDRL